jgi:acyl carrier protein
MSDLMMSSDERQARVESLLGRGDRPLSAEERAAVRAEIVGFLAEECGVEAAAITADTDLADDLGVDSLTFLELFQELESQYRLDLGIREVARYARDNPVATVGQLVDQICRFLDHEIDLAAAG